MLTEASIGHAWRRPVGRRKSAIRVFCDDQIEQFVALGFECAEFSGWDKFCDDYDTACSAMRSAAAGTGVMVSTRDGRIYLVKED